MWTIFDEIYWDWCNVQVTSNNRLDSGCDPRYHGAELNREFLKEFLPLLDCKEGRSSALADVLRAQSGLPLIPSRNWVSLIYTAQTPSIPPLPLHHLTNKSGERMSPGSGLTYTHNRIHAPQIARGCAMGQKATAKPRRYSARKKAPTP